MKIPGYTVDSISGQPIYRCVHCKYDVMDRKSIVLHCNNHPLIDLPETELPIGEWVAKEIANPRLVGKKITIGFLTWNQKEASTVAAWSIARELLRLEELGVECQYVWVDNGSTDGTVEIVQAILSGSKGTDCLCPSNMGQSIGRNEIIYHSFSSQSDYLLMLDGDIQLIPYSAYAMGMLLSATPNKVGCVGIYSYNCSPDVTEPLISPYMRKLEMNMITNIDPMAWTQYGMFRCKMFGEGIKFDTADCFVGPGWGLEDDDLYRQMRSKGYDSYCTRYFYYLHIGRSSSVAKIGEDLAAKVFEERKAHFLAKWKEDPDAYSHFRLVECARFSSDSTARPKRATKLARHQRKID